MRNQHDRRVLQADQRVECLLHQRLRLRIKRRRSLVQEEDLRLVAPKSSFFKGRIFIFYRTILILIETTDLPEHHPCDRDALENRKKSTKQIDHYSNTLLEILRFEIE